MAHAPTGVLHPPARAWPSFGLTGRWNRRITRILLGVAVVLAVFWLASILVEKPLRRQLEQRINASLTGYTATVGRVDLRVFGFGLDLYDVTVVQNSQPTPPLIYIPRWKTSVQWRALLSGALVADVAFIKPAFYMTLLQAESEAADPTPATDHGWQDAVTSIYPLKVNLFKINDGSLYYWDAKNPTPVHLRTFSVRAENIRNVRSVPGRYPSPFEFDATLADGAHLRFDGRADFLAAPHATFRGGMSLRDLGLVGLRPALRDLDIAVEGGKLAAQGHIEYTPRQMRLALDRVTLAGARIDYVQRTAADERALDEATKAATTSEAEPATRLDVTEAVIRDGTFGLVNKQTDPPYRLFVANTDARVTHFSNQRSARRGAATLSGRFMGLAPMQLDAEFAPAAKKADFDLKVRVEDVQLPVMNDYLRAQAGIDVTKGWLSVYSELRVNNGRVEGYVKPLFRDMDVYDREQDKEKGPLRQAYEALVGAGSSVLTNIPRDQVATVAELSGPVENPNSSTLDVVLGLLRNAYIKAIRPGLEPHRR
jgi:hypothetical protein